MRHRKRHALTKVRWRIEIKRRLEELAKALSAGYPPSPVKALSVENLPNFSLICEIKNGDFQVQDV